MFRLEVIRNKAVKILRVLRFWAKCAFAKVSFTAFNSDCCAIAFSVGNEGKRYNVRNPVFLVR